MLGKKKKAEAIGLKAYLPMLRERRCGRLSEGR